MTDQKFFVQTIKKEIPIFDRVFSALPNKPSDHRAHPKNKGTIELASSMLFESSWFPMFLKTGVVNIEADQAEKPKADDIKKISHDFSKYLEETHKMVSNMDEDDWNSPSEMMMGKNNVGKSTKGGMAWDLLIDLIHHRGQLSTHIRPQGGKVPSIYGPSGDSGM